jgi:hypothetical protein
VPTSGRDPEPRERLSGLDREPRRELGEHAIRELDQQDARGTGVDVAVVTPEVLTRQLGDLTGELRGLEGRGDAPTDKERALERLDVGGGVGPIRPSAQNPTQRRGDLIGRENADPTPGCSGASYFASTLRRRTATAVERPTYACTA